MAEQKNPDATPEKVEICKDRSKYINARTASGKMSKRSDDLVAQCFEGLTLDQKYSIANTLLDKVTEPELRDKYAHLNVGLQGMSLANRIRPVVAKDELAAKKLQKLVEPMQKARAAAAANAAKEKAAADAAKAKAKAEKEAAKAKAQKEAAKKTG